MKKWLRIIAAACLALLAVLLLYQIWGIYKSAEGAAKRSCLESIGNTLAKNLEDSPNLAQEIPLSGEWRILEQQERTLLLSTIRDASVLDCGGMIKVVDWSNDIPQLILQGRRSLERTEISVSARVSP